MRLAKKMGNLGTETAFEVLARAKALEAEGRKVVHLEIGEPDFDTPANIIRAGVEAMQGGWTHYGPSAGLPELREAIAAEIGRTRGIKVGADEVVVVPGGKPIMFFLMLAVLEEGTEAVYPNPGFPIYESMIRYTGAKAVPVPLREENEFALDVEELAGLLNENTRLLILNSPSNPCGGVLSKGDLDRLAKVLEAYPDLWILSDEIYSRILYEGEHHSLASYPELRKRVVILDGFSKTYAMTGWRLGYGVMDPELAARIAQLQTNATSCTAAFTQRAGIEALTGPQDEVVKMVQEFQRRRDVIVDGLNALPGVSCKKPKGAFYVFPNVKELGKPSKELENLLLEKAGVASLTGTSFGAHGEGYLRFSYANSVENIEEALRRFRALIEADFAETVA
ncbi:MAG TPA: pyridoxal phosphate-dependent aminotransferase [Planctomycetes bacterium]|nr:pyridoxal phosphate-dependent aminotransferase [Planctomycetota bacterium]